MYKSQNLKLKGILYKILYLQPDGIYGQFNCWLIDDYVLCPWIVALEPLVFYWGFFWDNVTWQEWTAVLFKMDNVFSWDFTVRTVITLLSAWLFCPWIHWHSQQFFFEHRDKGLWQRQKIKLTTLNIQLSVPSDRWSESIQNLITSHTHNSHNSSALLTLKYLWWLVAHGLICPLYIVLFFS